MSFLLEQYFPILEVTGGCIVAKSGDYTVGFELTKPEIFTLSGEELRRRIEISPYQGVGLADTVVAVGCLRQQRMGYPHQQGTQ